MKRRNTPARKQISFANPEAIVSAPEDDASKRIRSLQIRGAIKNMRQHFREYSEKSSLHGIQYIGEKGRPFLERLCWVVIFGVSIYMCLNLIMQTWNKWNTRPVIVSFAHKPNAVWQIPFPAITICSEVKSRQTVFNFTKQLENTNRTDEEQEKLEAVSLLCSLKQYRNGTNFTSEKALDIFEEVAPTFEETFLKCIWYGYNVPCKIIFSQILTAEGVCYTYNMLRSSELFVENIRHQSYLRHNSSSSWTIENGYDMKVNFTKQYPDRTMGVGNEGGVQILLNTNDFDYDYACRGPTQGFKILLHSPIEIPAIDQKFLMIPTNQEFTIAVKPDMTKTSTNLKAYEAKKRHCFFQDEKQLKFHKIYTADNCQMECITSYVLSKCGCIAFYMPQFYRMLQVISEFVSEDDPFGKMFSKFEKCNCLPPCTTLVYNIETSQADFDWQEYPEILPRNINNTKGMKVSRVSIFFKDTHFVPSYRSELYGPTDFIANCGGLLGLFMGFSFISVIEIIYFLTLRIWCNISMRSRRIWAIVSLKQLKDEPPTSTES